MGISNWIVHFRRHLKRKNYSSHTVKNYLNMLQHYIRWLDVPVEAVLHTHIGGYIDFLMEKRLHPKTINCHLGSIRVFYDYLCHEEEIKLTNPVRKGVTLRLPSPLPRHLKDEEIMTFFNIIKKQRDKALFTLMLRCGLRVEEVSNLTLGSLDLRRRRIIVHNGKGQKDRVVYVSDDANFILEQYIRLRPKTKAKQVFLVEKGRCKGQGLSVRGIQKRMEYYAGKTGLNISCHHLRHTMATQMLNADAELSTIQDLLGHNWITTTQRYCTVSNIKVQRDYFKAMEEVMKKGLPIQLKPDHQYQQ
ncbi:MAG: tyrosine-type recombinase/integrase [Proteobacteria bacterium]|nr:tyrosine-type recombinase/integrase [Pseudomonadota bacterium]